MSKFKRGDRIKVIGGKHRGIHGEFMDVIPFDCVRIIPDGICDDHIGIYERFLAPEEAIND